MDMDQQSGKINKDGIIQNWLMNRFSEFEKKQQINLKNHANLELKKRSEL